MLYMEIPSFEPRLEADTAARLDEDQLEGR
jgi:hypothetical protein